MRECSFYAATRINKLGVRLHAHVTKRTDTCHKFDTITLFLEMLQSFVFHVQKYSVGIDHARIQRHNATIVRPVSKHLIRSNRECPHPRPQLAQSPDGPISNHHCNCCPNMNFFPISMSQVLSSCFSASVLHNFRFSDVVLCQPKQRETTPDRASSSNFALVPSPG